jgi:DNA repair protein RadA/Sms
VSAPALPIGAVAAEAAASRPSGIVELDRVIGGGLVPGAVLLLAGEPGVGKSTLLLEVAAQAARRGDKALYVSGEESAAQVRMRATRTGAVEESLFIAAETSLGAVLGHVEVWAGRRLIGRRPLVASRTVNRPGLAARLGWYAGRTVHHVIHGFG